MEKFNPDNLIENYFEDTFEEQEEKPLTTEELKAELQKLSQDLKKKCGNQSESCLLMKRLALLHKYNESQSQNLFTPSSDQHSRKKNRSNSLTTFPTRISTNLNQNISYVNRTSEVLKFHTIETEEYFCCIDDVIAIYNSVYVIQGEFFMTNYRFVFVPYNMELFTKEFLVSDYFVIPYTFIVDITKKKEIKVKHKHILTFQIRDRPQISIGFICKETFEEIYCHLLLFTQPKNIKNFFAFKYHMKYEKIKEEFENGWGTYKFFSEYMRMGVKPDDPNSKYKLYIQEVHGEICDTYPNFVFIHKNTTDEDLKKISNFRSKKRFPALIWFSKNNNSSLWRSSQAKTGVIDRRNSHEEIFFNQLSKETEKFHIYDARPYLNALANKIKGFGYENSDNYKNCQMFFCDIENIHKVKESYHKMQLISQLPLENYDNWLHDLHNTGWLQIISRIMKSSINIVASLLENTTVLVHCSDGWDRTPQLTSLAQIIIDPYYRTLEGFAVLIEKDWVSFGHQFAFRNGHSLPRDDNNTSPVFLQWLDIIHQLLFQFPDLFEFNNDLLLFLSYHVFSCMYGTFLMNSEKESIEHLLKFKTVSIWTDVNRNKEKFINPNYDNVKSSRIILTPNCALYKLRVWEEYFLRWNPYYVMNNSGKLKSPYV